MSTPVLYATDVLADLIHGGSDAVSRFRAETAGAAPCVSAITKLELIAGCRDKDELARLRRFLKRFRVIKIDEATCDRALALSERFHLSHGLSPAGSIVAATALVYELPLVTRRPRDYRFIRGLALPEYR